MGRQKLHEITFPRVKEYMAESDKAVTGEDIANYLGMSQGGVWNVMQLMMAFKMVQKVKRGRAYYVLPGLSEAQIESMLPRKTASTRRRRRTRRPPPIEDGVEEYLVAVGEKTGDGLSALAMIGLPPEKNED